MLPCCMYVSIYIYIIYLSIYLSIYTHASMKCGVWPLTISKRQAKANPQLHYYYYYYYYYYFFVHWRYSPRNTRDSTAASPRPASKMLIDCAHPHAQDVSNRVWDTASRWGEDRCCSDCSDGGRQGSARGSILRKVRSFIEVRGGIE